jgi:hypothetical protein
MFFFSARYVVCDELREVLFKRVKYRNEIRHAALLSRDALRARPFLQMFCGVTCTVH